jgi:hypothetical protein
MLFDRLRAGGGGNDLQAAAMSSADRSANARRETWQEAIAKKRALTPNCRGVCCTAAKKEGAKQRLAKYAILD